MINGPPISWRESPDSLKLADLGGPPKPEPDMPWPPDDDFFPGDEDDGSEI